MKIFMAVVAIFCYFCAIASLIACLRYPNVGTEIFWWHMSRRSQIWMNIFTIVNTTAGLALWNWQWIKDHLLK